MPYSKLSALAKERIPFLFISNFDASKIHVYRLDELEDEDIEFSFNTHTNIKHQHKLLISPIDYKHYKKGFDKIIQKIKEGHTYLLNFTHATKISSALSLKEIFKTANAPFKLRYKDQFVCFSPERFITIKENIISTFPMKGTIDASIENAHKRILSDEKEMAEHVMIVDLLRNDLGIVARNIKVEKFRYIDKINAGEKELLQVSSHISAHLDKDWQGYLESILKNLLPAGSISGTPKKRTVELIKEIEDYNRDYFSGVFGIYDGESFESAVMIRFIEQQHNQLVYKSGGGITLDSDAQREYQEMIDKIYIP